MSTHAENAAAMTDDELRAELEDLARGAKRCGVPSVSDFLDWGSQRRKCWARAALAEAVMRFTGTGLAWGTTDLKERE